MDQPKFERLLRLIKLLTGNTSLTVGDLAKRLSTSYRSIYRYIETFKEAGFVVQKVGPGIYQLVSVNKKVPDLSKIIYFSDEEASVLSRLIESLDNTDTLKQNLSKKLATVYECAPVTDFIGKNSNAMNVRDLRTAINERRQVILHGYKSSNSNTISDRHIEPFALTTNHIMVWAYDYKDSKCKTFGIARIGETEILDAEWEHQKEHRKGGMDIFRMQGGTPSRVKLELGQTARNLLLEEYPLSEEFLQPCGDKWILDIEVRGMQGVGRFVMGLADDIRIIEGDKLKDYLRCFLDKYAARLVE